MAGVSRFTVSCVVNNLNGGNVRISEVTRQRVLNVIESLGYIPNRNARSLRTRKTCTIAAIIPDITNPFYPYVERGIQTVAEDNGYDLIMYNTDGVAEKELRCLRSVQHNMVDGAIVFLFSLDPEYLNELVGKRIPVVYFINYPNVPDHIQFGEGIDYIGTNNFQAAMQSVTYLIDKGHRQIGILTATFGPPRERVSGYKQALIEKGLPIQDELISEGSDYTEVGGKEAMQKLLSRPMWPTAVFAINDLMALGAMMAIREAGLKIPQDIAILGFDDIPAARLVSPALTTTSHNQEFMGQTAARMLFERLSSREPLENRVRLMPHRFIIRESA